MGGVPPLNLLLVLPLLRYGVVLGDKKVWATTAGIPTAAVVICIVCTRDAFMPLVTLRMELHRVHCRVLQS